MSSRARCTHKVVPYQSLVGESQANPRKSSDETGRKSTEALSEATMRKALSTAGDWCKSSRKARPIWTAMNTNTAAHRAAKTNSTWNAKRPKVVSAESGVRIDKARVSADNDGYETQGSMGDELYGNAHSWSVSMIVERTTRERFGLPSSLSRRKAMKPIPAVPAWSHGDSAARREARCRRSLGQPREVASIR